jgi:hypothetical protein
MPPSAGATTPPDAACRDAGAAPSGDERLGQLHGPRPVLNSVNQPATSMLNSGQNRTGARRNADDDLHLPLCADHLACDPDRGRRGPDGRLPRAGLVAPALRRLCLASVLVGLHDLRQTRHAVLRNYPVAAHLRFLLESIRPEMRQYFFEGDKDGTPFPRDKRAIVYQRAKRSWTSGPSAPSSTSIRSSTNGCTIPSRPRRCCRMRRCAPDRGQLQNSPIPPAS